MKKGIAEVMGQQNVVDASSNKKIFGLKLILLFWQHSINSEIVPKKLKLIPPSLLFYSFRSVTYVCFEVLILHPLFQKEVLSY